MLHNIIIIVANARYCKYIVLVHLTGPFNLTLMLSSCMTDHLY